MRVRVRVLGILEAGSLESDSDDENSIDDSYMMQKRKILSRERLELKGQ